MTPVLDERKQRIAEQLDAEYVGVGWWGLLYRAPARRRWYRLIPASELNAEQRDGLSAWQSRPRQPDLVPVLSDDQQEDQQELAGQWFQVVSYESAAARSLAEVIAEDPVAERVSRVADVLRALPGWCEAIDPGLTVLPGEVVLDGRRPLLLPLPGWGPPSLREVFAEPERVAYLTPEAARGVADVRTPGLYALAVAARSCFETLPAGTATALMHRAACASAFADQHRDGRLPSWMRRVDQVQAVRERLRVLTGRVPEAVAGGVDPAALAAALDTAWQAMDPMAAVRSVRDAGEPRHAVALAHAALVDRPSYQLLLLAAEIARRDLREPFAALSLLERAVQTAPKRSEAAVEQLSIISGLFPEGMDLLVALFKPAFAARLETTARAAFDSLPPEQQRERAHAMARCLIGQGHLEEANTFVHRWLHEGDKLMWWQFDLMLDYVESFLLLALRRRPDSPQADNLLDTAEQMRDQTRAGLSWVRQNQTMPPSRIHRYGLRLAQLDPRLLAARNRRYGS
ncbi:hypothetical protein [Catenulispora pinisilvae]|uniref:hypothetical protein n=1 Tax=Catenulispora pinisilvae TaxID=2705253 RepID=UPI001890FAC2|nr:hypothetical protein [Catenulispora pinisilvae]